MPTDRPPHRIATHRERTGRGVEARQQTHRTTMEGYLVLEGSWTVGERDGVPYIGAH